MVRTMKTWTFSLRTAKELLRDPLNLSFGIGFPVVLLFLLSLIQSNIPVSLFAIDSLAPGIAVFGLSFLTLFSATLISKDRTSSLLSRLLTTPLTSGNYIFGYVLPMLPIALSQSAVCYLVSFLLGLKPTVNVLWSVLLMLPVAVFFIGLGLLCGSLLNDKQVGGVCGALLTNVSAWLSGTWFDLELVGGVFKKIAEALPFMHAVEMHRAVLRGDFAGIFPHLWWVAGYAVVTLLAAVLVFTGKKNRN